MLTLSAVAQTESQLRRKKEAIQREIEQLQKNLNKTASGKKLTIQQINTINAQIRLRQDKIGTINSEIKIWITKSLRTQIPYIHYKVS